MEIAHAKLSSLSRNFIVKYSDDETFNFDKYEPVDENKDKHKFFRIIERGNDRMQHLSLMTRLLLIEEADGYAELKDSAVVDAASAKGTLNTPVPMAGNANDFMLCSETSFQTDSKHCFKISSALSSSR